jgi:signal transduction histidine kinase
MHTWGNQIGVSDKPNDDRDAFGAIIEVAHELRTPLTAIQGAVEILRDGTAGELSPAQREFADLAHRNLARLKDRIEDALDIASLKSGPRPESPAVHLEEVATCVAKRAAVEAGPDLRIRFEGFSGEQRFTMEDQALCRTLASIIGTVGRHLGRGDVIVRASVEQSRIRFEVGADGPAGAGREHAVIHDASLALACKMVEIHGGVLSELETGCCGVYVLLPLWPICVLEER